MRLRIFHRTRYVYTAPVRESYNEVRMMPLSDEDQTCLDFRLSTTPTARIFAYDMPSGRVHHFDVRAPHSELIVIAEALVVTFRTDPFRGMQFTSEDRKFYQTDAVNERHHDFLAATERVPLYPEVDRIAAVARKQMGVGTASFLIALTRLLNRVIEYKPGTTTVNTPLQSVLEQRSGVCQDFAHLMLSVCRRQGIPSRYVSGYIYTGDHKSDLPGDVSEQGESGSDDFVGGGATHAWVECLLPDGRWHGFDPTNNLLTNAHYIKVHFGRDYGDVPPLRGVYRGPGAHTLDVAVRVLKEE